MKRLRANTLKDHSNFLFHFGLTAGVAAGAFAFLSFPPIISVIAIGATAGINFALMPKVGRAMQEAIDDEKNKSDLRAHNIDFESMIEDRLYRRVHMPTEAYLKPVSKLDGSLKRWVMDFSQRLGLDHIPHIGVIERDNIGSSLPGDKSLRSGLRQFLKTKFNEKANAFAFKDTHGNVILNSPIVEALNPRELKGVVGHEVGHLAAGHTVKRRMMAWFSTPTKILTALNALVTSFSSWKNAGFYFLGGTAGELIAGGISKFSGWTEENPAHKLKMANVKSLCTAACIAGLGLAFGAPDLTIAVALNYGVNRTLTLLEKRYSRRNEFQADRLAAELTGDPEGMAIGLRKIQRMHLRDALEHEPNEKPKHGVLSDVFARIDDLDKTHPNIDRRCARLERMPQRVEYVLAA